MEQQTDLTLLRHTTHSGTPFSPSRQGDVISVNAILQHVEDNNDLFASVSIYAHGDDGVDDNKDVAPRTPIKLPLNSQIDMLMHLVKLITTPRT
jgi:hypothetical protein